MAEIIVALALLFAVFLLAIVVVENTPALRRIGTRWQDRVLGIIGRWRRKEDREGTDMPVLDSVENSGEQLQGIIEEVVEVEEERQPAVNGKQVENSEEQTQGIIEEVAEVEEERRLSVNSKQDEAIMTLVDTMQREVDDLKNRLDKLDQLEDGLEKVSEVTQKLSDDRHEVIESLRTSIDGLEGRLEEIGCDHAQASPAHVEETKGRIEQLEHDLADINDIVIPLPQVIQSNADSVREVRNRLEVISTNLQRTLGYDIQRTFGCKACGSEGLVATQVVCSKCGNEGWWGWWPKEEKPSERENRKIKVKVGSSKG